MSLYIIYVYFYIYIFLCGHNNTEKKKISAAVPSSGGKSNAHLTRFMLQPPLLNLLCSLMIAALYLISSKNLCKQIELMFLKLAIAFVFCS